MFRFLQVKKLYLIIFASKKVKTAMYISDKNTFADGIFAVGIFATITPTF